MVKFYDGRPWCAPFQLGSWCWPISSINHDIAQSIYSDEILMGFP